MGLPETIEACLSGSTPISCVSFNPFGTLLASGCRNGDILLWVWSTRGLARTFTGGHTLEVTSLLWSTDGKQLLTASRDGTLTVWDVQQGAKIVQKNLGCGEITHMSVPAAFEVLNLPEAQLVVSFKESATEILTIHGIEVRRQVPALALDGDGRGARLLTGAAAAATSQLAIPSPCGNYIISAARGVVCLLSIKDLSVLDAVKLRGVPQRVTSLQFDSSGRRLLVGTTDRYIRIYTLPENVAEQPQNGTSATTAPHRGINVEALVAAHADKIPREGSLLLGDVFPLRKEPLMPLKLTRLFDAQVERLHWGPCAFSPDGEHVVSAIASPEEHIIYTWNVPHEYAENTLQAGSDGVVGLAWHPEPLPMQLVAVGSSGKLYVWAKVMTQDWSAFAPDFETLVDNREHVESETEFDVELPRDVKDVQDVGSGKEEEAKVDEFVNEGDVVDIDGWTEEGGGGCPEGIWHKGWEKDARLLHLSVILPTGPVAELEDTKEKGAVNGRDVFQGEKEEERKGTEAEVEAMDVEEDGDDVEKEMDAGGNGTEVNVAKKLRIE